MNRGELKIPLRSVARVEARRALLDDLLAAIPVPV